MATGLLVACGGGAAREPNVAEPVVSEETSAPSSAEPEEASTTAEPVTGTEPVDKIDTIDCSRIDDPEYRRQVEASGIDPESIDCGEDDTGD